MHRGRWIWSEGHRRGHWQSPIAPTSEATLEGQNRSRQRHRSELPPWRSRTAAEGRPRLDLRRTTGLSAIRHDGILSEAGA